MTRDNHGLSSITRCARCRGGRGRWGTPPSPCPTPGAGTAPATTHSVRLIQEVRRNVHLRDFYLIQEIIDGLVIVGDGPRLVVRATRKSGELKENTSDLIYVSRIAASHQIYAVMRHV